MKRWVIVVDGSPVELAHLCQRLRHGRSRKFCQNVWTPENQDYQQRSCKCMSLKEQCRPFSTGCLTFLRFFAQISDHHLKQTHCKYIISCKHNPGDQQMERIHKDQIPGVGVAEAIPKYQKKCCQYRGNPAGQTRYMLRPAARNFIEKEQDHQCKKRVPIGEGRQNIFQFFYIRCQQSPQAAACCFCTDPGKICIHTHHQCKTCQCCTDPVYYGIEIFFSHIISPSTFFDNFIILHDICQPHVDQISLFCHIHKIFQCFP